MSKKKSPTITKRQAVKIYGNQVKLAAALGIQKSAISKWPDGPIPEVYALRMRFVLKPEGLPTR